MKNLKQQIAEKLGQLEEMIGKEEDKEKIEKQRKILDNLLEEYLKNI